MSSNILTQYNEYADQAKRKRYAPRKPPQKPGTGDFKIYHGRIADVVVIIDNHREGMDLFIRGSYGKGLLSRSQPNFRRMRERELATLQQASSSSVSGKKRSAEVAQLDKEEDVEHSLSSDSEAQTALSVTNSSDLVDISDNHDSVLEYLSKPVFTDEQGEPLLLMFEEALYLIERYQCVKVKHCTEDRFYTFEELWRVFLSKRGPSFVSFYATYRVYRDNGWCVRCGVKFGSTWILYKCGPAYSHSSFQVIVMPQREQTLLENDAESRLNASEMPERSRSMDWANILRLNRMAQNVKKSLVLCHVILPADLNESDVSSPQRVYIHESVYSRWRVSAKQKAPGEEDSEDVSDG